jgi:hypothetical protein
MDLEVDRAVVVDITLQEMIGKAQLERASKSLNTSAGYDV